MLTNIVAWSPDEVRCDMLVEVTREDIAEEVSLTKFKLAHYVFTLGGGKYSLIPSCLVYWQVAWRFKIC